MSQNKLVELGATSLKLLQHLSCGISCSFFFSAILRFHHVFLKAAPASSELIVPVIQTKSAFYAVKCTIVCWTRGGAVILIFDLLRSVQLPETVRKWKVWSWNQFLTGSIYTNCPPLRFIMRQIDAGWTQICNHTFVQISWYGNTLKRQNRLQVKI